MTDTPTNNPFAIKRDQTLFDNFIMSSKEMMNEEQESKFVEYLERMNGDERMYIAYVYMGHTRDEAIVKCGIADESTDDNYKIQLWGQIEHSLSGNLVISILKDASIGSLILNRSDRQVALSQAIERGLKDGSAKGMAVAIRATEALNRMHGDEIVSTKQMNVTMTDEERDAFMEKLKDI